MKNISKKIIYFVMYVLGALAGVWGSLGTNIHKDPWNKWFGKCKG